MEIPKLIRVVQEGLKHEEGEISVVVHTLEIDGEPFPWYISEDGVQTQVCRGRMPGITITIPADRIEVVHGLDDPK